jgi:ribosomal protein S18 acetylase RimI-like enzyme
MFNATPAGPERPTSGAGYARSMRVPDIGLARALEGAEAAASRAFCERAAALYPSLPARAMACGGGVALHYAPSDPLNAVKGAGLAGAVEVGEWDAIEALFRRHGSPVVVDLCPFAEAAFVEMLGERGYRIAGFETVLYRELDDQAPAVEMPRDCAIEVPRAERAPEWGRVLGVGFADGGEPFPFAVDLARVRAGLEHSVMVLAVVGGVAAGGAALSMVDGTAHFSGAAVLPEFRGRGIQRALTASRIRIARERGCRLAKLDVLAGTVSHRNAERAGFRVAYTRPQMIRRWA